MLCYLRSNHCPVDGRVFKNYDSEEQRKVLRTYPNLRSDVDEPDSNHSFERTVLLIRLQGLPRSRIQSSSLSLVNRRFPVYRVYIVQSGALDFCF